MKPDLSAPGRYITAPVPSSSYLVGEKPTRVVAPGYMWMSGTSFSAPMVAGAAAQLLARKPYLTPNQVKGALMASARYLPSADPGAGVGELDAAAAAAIASPPNPNENLYAFVSNGDFNADAWASYVSVNANWTQSNWVSANWVSANWVASNWVGLQLGRIQLGVAPTGWRPTGSHPTGSHPTGPSNTRGLSTSKTDGGPWAAVRLSPPNGGARSGHSGGGCSRCFTGLGSTCGCALATVKPAAPSADKDERRSICGGD